MAKYQKIKPIPLFSQYTKIIQKYKNVDGKQSYFKKNEIKVRLKVKPTIDSDEYIVEVKYKLGFQPKVFLIYPKLKTLNGELPHHLYGEENGYPRLCLYYPKYKEWTEYDYISDTIIPWISTWLFAYEYWQITGTWNYSEITNKKVKVNESSDKKEN